MSDQNPPSMASPTDSAKTPANPDSARPVTDATSHAPTKLHIHTAQQTVASSGPKDKTILDTALAESPTLIPTDTVDQRKENVKSVEFSNTNNSSRRSSAASLRFETPRRPGLPQGNSRGINGRRIRNASPPPAKFRSHVAFDTIGPDNSKNSGITLSARHNGFHAQRRSKTFMVGVDEHKYSEEALEWLLTAMVDDHDTIVCVRVIEKDVKPQQNGVYKEQARKLLQWIIMKNNLDKAICIILEYQFGRLGPTFDTMVNVHQPSMLVVGTKGKSNHGMQGMWNTRHSFSKYCLEKSSVPVVVVRPEDVRRKKKDKRARDPNRNSYAQMLSATGGVHESDLMDDQLLLATVTQLSSLDEASQVAKALALPAEFDPTIRGIGLVAGHRAAPIVVGQASGGAEDTKGDGSPDKVRDAVDSAAKGSDDDDDDDSDEDIGFGDAKAPPNQVPDPVKKERLHEMEVGEAAALKKRNTGDIEDDDER